MAGKNGNPQHYKVKLNGFNWTVYKDGSFIAKGTYGSGETIIEESTETMKEDLIYLLIEDALN